MALSYPFAPKKILVPLDATAASVAAWKQAKALGAALGASVQGLYVEALDGLGELRPMHLDRARVVAGLRWRLDAGEDEIGSTFGPIEGTILSWAENLDYDLVVMGTHARTGWRRALEGSVAEAVARESKVPVLVVRRKMRPVRDVLAPVCFEAHAQAGLEAAAKIALAARARLTLLHVVSSPLYGGPGSRGPERLLAAELQRLPAEVKKSCRPRARLAFGDPALEIAKAAAETDLVVVSAHRREFLSERVLGTTTERLIRYSPAAVLAVPVKVREPAAAK